MDELSTMAATVTATTATLPLLSPEMPASELVEYTGQSPQFQHPAISPTDQESGVFSVDGTFFPNFIPDSLVSSLNRYNDPFEPSSLIPEFTHYGALEYPPFDFNLTDGDFGLIDMYNSGNIFPSIYDEKNQQDSFDADSGIGIGAEAYNRSSLSAWKPAQEDKAGVDHESLSIPQNINSPEAIATPDQQILCDRLSSSSRDLIFGLVLEISREVNLTRIMKSFPSTELLDGLIQQCFERQARNVVSFIHAPTFRPNSEHASILAAMASSAAVHSPIPTIRKLGYALTEIVRLYMPTKVSLAPISLVRTTLTN
jgi:hypothetical protein